MTFSLNVNSFPHIFVSRDKVEHDDLRQIVKSRQDLWIRAQSSRNDHVHGSKGVQAILIGWKITLVSPKYTAKKRQPHLSAMIVSA